LKDAADFWYEQLLNFDLYPDGYAGYKTYVPSKNKSEPVMTSSLDLIEGISGIGLALLYAVFNQDPTWEKAFLIS